MPPSFSTPLFLYTSSFSKLPVSVHSRTCRRQPRWTPSLPAGPVWLGWFGWWRPQECVSLPPPTMPSTPPPNHPSQDQTIISETLRQLKQEGNPRFPKRSESFRRKEAPSSLSWRFMAGVWTTKTRPGLLPEEGVSRVS